MVLPTPYIKQAMEVVSGDRIDQVALPAPAPVPAIEPPKAVTLPPKTPTAPPTPAPVPAKPEPAKQPAPAAPVKPFRPPQSLCFNWNERTRQYEATTVEARDFLAALLGLKESSKSTNAVQVCRVLMKSAFQKKGPSPCSIVGSSGSIT